MHNWRRIVYLAEGLRNHAQTFVLQSYTTVRAQTNASACLSAASSKGTVTRDGDNELAIQIIVITVETLPKLFM